MIQRINIQKAWLTTIKLIKITVISTLGVLCAVILGVYLYLNSIDPKIVDISFLKTPQFSFFDFRDKATVRIKVNECSKSPLSDIPRIIQKTFLILNDVHFFERKFPHINIIGQILIDCQNYWGGGYYGFYDPDIITKVAHNSLVIKRKARPFRTEEIFLAGKIDRRYSKAAILERYLNQLYFGNGIFGVEAAARFYFNKSLPDLQIHQIAFLAEISIDYYAAGMPYKRYFRSKILLKKRNDILDSMAGGNLISPMQAKTFKQKPLDVVANLERK